MVRASHKAWAATVIGIGAYEALCPLGETMSEGLDDFVDKPIGKAVIGVLGAVTIAHLINICPESIDIYHKLGNLKERIRHE